jgi:hypothetical protein
MAIETIDPRVATDGPLARLAAYWRAWRSRAELDALILRGAFTHSSPELVFRARQLTTPGNRHNLACEFDMAVAAIDDPDSRRALDLCGEQVRDARAALLELAQRLRSPEPCAARGIVMCRSILRDASSPLFQPALHGELDRAARCAHVALSAG